MNHIEFYRYAKYYDIAFDFKNIKEECLFIKSLYEKYNKRKAQSFLELACGPSLHVLEFSKDGLFSLGIDLESSMVNYSKEKTLNWNLKAEFKVADMIDFDLKQKFDIAAILMDSTSYLLDNEQVISHLNSVSKHLNKGGIYILEMSHTRDVFNQGDSSETSWKMEKDGIIVDISWGSKNDYFDPITQITQITVNMKVNDNGKEIIIKDKAPQRCFTANEFKALIKASGKFEIVDIFGAMNFDVPFSNDEKAWRFIPVLRNL